MATYFLTRAFGDTQAEEIASRHYNGLTNGTDDSILDCLKEMWQMKGEVDQPFPGYYNDDRKNILETSLVAMES